MSHSTESFTTSDGLELHVNTWTVETPKAIVIIAHGLAEHSGRYAHVAATLNNAGYHVVAPDHRSHGNSPGQPRAYVKDTTVFVDDLKVLWDQVAGEYTGLPIFLTGHSLGGLIAAQFALRYQDQMRGLVTSGAGLLPGEDVPPFAVRVGKLLARIAPKMALVALDSAAVSRDPDVVARYNNDPLNYRGKIRAGIGGSLFINGEAVLQQAHTLTLPMLVMHGEADRLIPAQASRLLYERASSTDKTLKIYPELYHEIFNEPEQQQVFADLVAWLDAH